MSGWRGQHRGRNCLIAAAIVLVWSVFAWGTSQDIVVPGEVEIPPEGDIIFHPNTLKPVRTIAFVATGLVALICLWALPRKRLLPRIPWPLATALGFLVLYGWLMVANAGHVYDRDTFDFKEVERAISLDWAPRSIARTTSFYAVAELSMLAIMVVAVLRCTEGKAWRRLLAVIAVLGGVVALVGMYHRAAGAPAVYWEGDATQPSMMIFAPYVYNANAAAFMNLCIPLSLGFALAGVGDESRRARSIAWFVVATVTMAGVVVAASKGGWIVLAATLPVYVIWNWRRFQTISRMFFVQRGRKTERVTMMVSFGVLLVSLVGIGITLAVKRWDEFVTRWEEGGEGDLTGRIGVIRLMGRMIGPEEGGWHGFGPNTFQYLVARFNVAESGATEELKAGDWKRGHCDPMQTLVEWGWVGAAAWFAIGIGAVVCGLLLLRHKNWMRSADDVPLLRGTILALVMVGIHSCQDFPLSIYSIHLVAMILCAVCWGLYANCRHSFVARMGRRKGD